MASNDMSNWIQFFKAAGIPPGAATSYATLFTNNRIQMSMLMDLTKEYLKDMGILVLGDIIAILKYAKTAHSMYEREKPAVTAMGLKADEKVELKRQRTPGGRMLEHYMRKEGIIDNTPPQKVTVSPSMAVRLGAVPSRSSPSPAKRSATTPKAVEVVPVKRVRKVDPSEEGHYVISLPKGTTPRTQKILQKKMVNKSPAVGKSVFNRLGAGGNSTNATTPSTSASDASSVFNRLGGKQRVRSLSAGSEESVLSYQGVLKHPKPAHATEKTLTVKIPAVFQDRLGVQKPEVSTTSAAMDKQFMQQKIQVRLGSQKPMGIKKTITTGKTGNVQNIRMNTQGLKKTITGGVSGGGVFAQTVKPLMKRTPIQAPGRQTSNEPKVTITMGGAKSKSNIHARLGANASPNPANRSAFGGGGSQAGVKMISTTKRKPAVTMVSDTPQKKTTVKERLGVQKAEASSTTPAFTVKLGGKNTQRLAGKGQQLKGKRGGKGGGNVFSRLGST